MRSAPDLLLVVAVTVVLAVPGGAAAQSGELSGGRDVFEANCAMCHGRDAGGMMGMHPSLRGAVERLSLEGVEVTIRKGRDTNPPMPSFGGRLSEEEIDDVVAYIDTLPNGPRNFGPEERHMMNMDGMMGGGMWSWIGAIALLLLLVAGIVIASALSLRVLWKRGDDRPTARDPALEILRERFARGEINRDEYEERRRALQSRPSDA